MLPESSLLKFHLICVPYVSTELTKLTVNKKIFFVDLK